MSFTYRSCQLRIIDLRPEAVFRTTCPGPSVASTPVCFYSCPYIERPVLCLAAECQNHNLEPEDLSSVQTPQIITDLSLNDTLQGRELFSLLVRKIEQSSGTLHICCRNLKIEKLSEWKSSLRFLDLKCVAYMRVEHASLSDVTKVLCSMRDLDGITLSKIICRPFTGRALQRFSRQLKRMTNLSELSLSYFGLTNHLELILR